MKGRGGKVTKKPPRDQGKELRFCAHHPPSEFEVHGAQTAGEVEGLVGTCVHDQRERKSQIRVTNVPVAIIVFFGFSETIFFKIFNSCFLKSFHEFPFSIHSLIVIPWTSINASSESINFHWRCLATARPQLVFPGRDHEVRRFKRGEREVQSRGRMREKPLNQEDRKCCFF